MMECITWRCDNPVSDADIAAGLRRCPECRASERRTGRSLYPKVCDFVGVHPSQIPQASRFLEQRGVEPSFTPEGDFAPQSKQHFNAYNKAMGYHEKDTRHGKMSKKV